MYEKYPSQWKRLKALWLAHPVWEWDIATGQLFSVAYYSIDRPRICYMRFSRWYNCSLLGSRSVSKLLFFTKFNIIHRCWRASLQMEIKFSSECIFISSQPSNQTQCTVPSGGNVSAQRLQLLFILCSFFLQFTTLSGFCLKYPTSLLRFLKIFWNHCRRLMQQWPLWTVGKDRLVLVWQEFCCDYQSPMSAWCAVVLRSFWSWRPLIPGEEDSVCISVAWGEGLLFFQGELETVFLSAFICWTCIWSILKISLPSFSLSITIPCIFLTMLMTCPTPSMIWLVSWGRETHIFLKVQLRSTR